MYEDVSSPTATTTSVMAMAAVAAWEGRKVMTVDVGGAFLHADIKLAGGELVHVELDEIKSQLTGHSGRAWGTSTGVRGTPPCLVTSQNIRL